METIFKIKSEKYRPNHFDNENVGIYANKNLIDIYRIKNEYVYIYVLYDEYTKQIFYVGKTINPIERLHSHWKHKKTKDYCEKYNTIQFIKNEDLILYMEIIDKVPDSEWEFWEKHYISLYKSWGFSLANIYDGGRNGNLGYKHSDKAKKLIGIGNSKPKSDDFKKKVSIRMLNTPKTEHPAFGKNRKPIYQYTLDGCFLKKWEYSSQIKDSLFYNIGLICTCCNGKIRQAYGFQWKYFFSEKINTVSPPRDNIKKIKILDLKINKIYEFESIKQACSKLKISRNSITNQLNGFVSNPRSYKVIK